MNNLLLIPLLYFACLISFLLGICYSEHIDQKWEKQLDNRLLKLKLARAIKCNCGKQWKVFDGVENE